MADIAPQCVTPTHSVKDSSGNYQFFFDSSCYYPGSGCLLANTQCVSTFKETGCKAGDQQYQCAQTYYLKQQTQAKPQVQPVVNTNTNQESATLKMQLQEMQKQIETLQSKQATVTATTVPPAQPTPLFENPVVPYSILGILIVGIVVLMKMKIITLTSKP
jgi:hypothetical protein